MRKFKRLIQFPVLVVLALLLFFEAILLIILTVNSIIPNSIQIQLLSIIAILAFLLTFIVVYVFPEDFEYTIKKIDNYIFFEFSEKDYRRIGQNFVIVSKTRKHIVLDDGITQIKVAYNQKVLQFLEEIQT